ncbi:hypothetical protein J2X97_000367 [Epilithonimonas hungarica]|uniref:hypothetical protein n=1 Tax=Epilithonimonas hungarica TaxID=454006 RepID=UPI0027810E46|nr:hypothetical protein [Epilithonimonas hungarica]MDP9954730.1 hypothetical protein [Epilithonimonas hungarica]
MATENQNQELSAKNLKNVLWETLQGVKNGEIEAGKADSIAVQAREILRTTSIQLRISQQSKREVPVEVLNFSEK